MSNLWLNIRFLYWHLQAEYGKRLPRVVRNEHLKAKGGYWWLPLALYECRPWNWKGISNAD